MKAVAFLGRTAFITGASRGIGKEIALKLAKDGANIVIAAKTAEAHPKLPGTIYTAAEEIIKAGGKALPCIVDVRDEKSVEDAVKQAVDKFGGIDIVINNASAISLTGTEDTPMKRYDLMHQINTRGTYLVSQKCIPYLRKGKNPHILNISPPLCMEPHWFSNHVAYTMAKYGMSMCVLGMHEELRPDGIAVNALWPWSAVWTAAMDMLGGEEAKKGSRWPSIMADAAYAILKRDSRKYTGNFAIDEDVLKEEGITDLDQYAVDPSTPISPDFFLPPEQLAKAEQRGSKSIYEIRKDAAPASGGDSSSIFAALKTLPLGEFVPKTKAVFEFNIDGGKPSKIYIDLKNGNGSVGEGSAPGGADVVFGLSATDFPRLFNGQLSPTTAFMEKKLKIKGDVSKALKLEALLKTYNKQSKSKI